MTELLLLLLFFCSVAAHIGQRNNIFYVRLNPSWSLDALDSAIFALEFMFSECTFYLGFFSCFCVGTASEPFVM